MMPCCWASCARWKNWKKSNEDESRTPDMATASRTDTHIALLDWAIAEDNAMNKKQMVLYRRAFMHVLDRYNKGELAGKDFGICWYVAGFVQTHAVGRVWQWESFHEKMADFFRQWEEHSGVRNYPVGGPYEYTDGNLFSNPKRIRLLLWSIDRLNYLIGDLT